MTKPALRIGVSYDFRNPPDSGVGDQYLYAEILEQVQWLDSIGADLVWFTEHHFVEDGYLPVGCPWPRPWPVLRNMCVLAPTFALCRSIILFGWRKTLRCSITFPVDALI